MSDPKKAIAAAAKHLNDANLLFEANRPDNAGYLSGYVVECCLKSLLVHPSLPADKELGHDLFLQMGRVWQYCLALAPARRRITLPSSVAIDKLLADWKPDLRYDPAGTMNAATAAEFLAAAESVFIAIAVALRLDHASYNFS